MNGVIQHLIFERKHELNTEKQSSAQSFPHFSRSSFSCSSQHVRGSEVVMQFHYSCEISRLMP